MLKAKHNIKIIEDGRIRRQFDEKTGRWYFSIVDVIEMLTETADARNYWKVLKNRLKKAQNELVTKCNQLKMKAKDGKFYLTDVADPETLLKIINLISEADTSAWSSYLSNIPEKGMVEEKEDIGVKLLVDVYQIDNNIFIEAMVAGTLSDDISILIFQKQVIIRGRRININYNQNKNEYLFQELIWDNFSRTVLLPSPVRTDSVEKFQDNGRMTIKLTKI